MDKTVNIFILGKKYEVPAGATIMGAFEYAGYRLVRGCGCRHGFCGACAAIYRVKGMREIKVALACHTQVADGMYLASLPFFPVVKQRYNMDEIRPGERVLFKLYPEIYSCIGCNACTKGCPQELNTMQYISYARQAEYEKCARESFDCVMCGICSSRCPAGISHPQTALLVRRLYGKYIAKASEHLRGRVEDINEGKFDEELDSLISSDITAIKELYNSRDIEE